MILLGDCLDELSKLPDASVDMVLCDPPYGTTACKWDTVIPLKPFWEQLHRVTKPTAAICMFGSEPFSSALRMSNIKRFKYDWIWKKSNPANFAVSKYQPLKYHEIISVFGGVTSYFPQMIERKSERIQQANDSGYKFWNTQPQFMRPIGTNPKKPSSYDAKFKNPSSVLEVNSIRPNSKERAGHPTQKPVALLEYLIRTYTNEGETVLDPTMGSGSTGVACINTGRKFIGIEREPDYFQIAEARLVSASISAAPTRAATQIAENECLYPHKY